MRWCVSAKVRSIEVDVRPRRRLPMHLFLAPPTTVHGLSVVPQRRGQRSSRRQTGTFIGGCGVILHSLIARRRSLIGTPTVAESCSCEHIAL